MKKQNNKNINGLNPNSAWVASNSTYNVSTKKELNKFLKTCSDRIEGRNRFADHGYIVGIIQSVDFLGEINDYFNENDLDITKLKQYRIYIQLSETIPAEELERINILKRDRYSYIQENIKLLDKTINNRLKPEVLKFLVNNEDKAGIKRNIDNVHSAIFNVELTWYYKYLLKSNINLISKIHFNYSKFDLYSRNVANNLPIKKFNLTTESQYKQEVLKNPIYKEINQKVIRDYLVFNPEVKTYSQAMHLAYLFREFSKNAGFFGIDKKFKKFILTESHKLLSYLLINYREEIVSFEQKYSLVLKEKINECNTLFNEVWDAKDKINFCLESLVSTDLIKNIIVSDNIIKEVKKIDFFLMNLYSILTRVNTQTIEPLLRDTIVETIIKMENVSKELLTYVDTFREFRIKDRKSLVSFDIKHGLWLNKNSILEKPDFNEVPANIDTWFRETFFKVASIKTVDRYELYELYGLSYFYNVVPLAYSSFSNLLNILKIYLVNLEVILKNNANLVKRMNLDSDSSDVINLLFSNYIKTTEKMKLSVFNIINNIELLGTAATVVKKEDLLKYKEIVDSQLNISNEFNSISIIKKTVGFNSSRVSNEEFNNISKIIFEIESIVRFIKNAAIGMSVSINFLIESSELIIKDVKAKELIENDDLFDITKYADKIRTFPEIIVPFRSNIHTINQDNWYTSERVFNTESSIIVDKEINALYDEIKKVNHIYDNTSEPINLNNAKPIFDNLWDLYIREQGIVNELSRLSSKTEDLANDRYLKIAFTKAKLELYENNLIFDVEKQLLIEDMLSHKIWLLKIFAAQSDIYKSLLKHKSQANLLTDRLEKLFTNSRYGLETLTKFIYEWYQNKDENLNKILSLDPITDNVKVKFIGETISDFNSFVNMKKISENSLYNEWMPKSIFTKFVSRNMINSLIDLVPIVNYEKDDDALEYNDKFISPYTEIEKEKEKIASDNEFNAIIQKYENTIEGLKQQLESKNKVSSFSNDIRYVVFELNKPEINEKEINKIINANIYEPVDSEFVEFIRANDIPLSDEELSLLVHDEPETIYDINDSVSREEPIIFFGEAPEDGVASEIREVGSDFDIETQSENTNFENEKVNIIYSDTINDDNINYEKVSVVSNDWDESSKEDEEEIATDNYDEIETKFEPVIVEYNYVDNYLVEKKSKNKNIEEIIIANEKPLLDSQLIEWVFDGQFDEIEYIYVNEKPLTDEELLKLTFVIVNPAVSEYQYVDPSAPYANQIKEITDSISLDNEFVLVDETQNSIEETQEDEIEYIYANDKPLSDSQLIRPSSELTDSKSKEYQYVSPSAPYADPINEVEIDETESQELVEFNSEDIETIYADETQLLDSELIKEEIIEQPVQDEMECIYADESPLSDSDLLIPEIIEVSDYNNASVIEEEFTIVDELAPYADPINEIDSANVIEQDDSEIEFIAADETQLSDFELIKEEVIEQPVQDEIECIYADESPLSDSDLLIPEIIEVSDDNSTSVIEEEFAIVDESAPYADPINEVEIDETKSQELVEFNSEDIETIYADETQLLDSELIKEEIIEQPVQDEMECIYADESPLSDSDLLIPEIIEVSDDDNTSVNEEEFTIVDELAPYADPINEIDSANVIEQDDSEIEFIVADETQLSDSELIKEEVIEQPVQDEIECIYADESPLSDSDLLIPEIIEVSDDDNTSVIEEEFTIVDESAPYADPINEVEIDETESQELVEFNSEDIETIYADETQLLDSELIKEEVIEQPVQDEIECIYADESPLSDSDLLIPEIIEVSDNDNISVIEEEFTIVDELAPYADPINETEIDLNNLENLQEVAIDFSGIEPIQEDNTDFVIVEPEIVSDVNEEEILNEFISSETNIDEEFADLSIYNNNLSNLKTIRFTDEFSSLNDTYLLDNKLKVLELGQPESTDKELDWFELNSNSHTILNEEPVFIKSFKILY